MLRLEGLRVAFGGVAALAGIDLVVETGTVVGLVGPNGSGKSTLLDAVTGTVRATAGRVLLDGSDLTTLPAWRIARLGIARTFQTPRLFTRLAVAENVPDASLCREFDLPPAMLAGDLTLAQRRKLELARAIGAAPRLLLLDEPLGGLGRREAETLLPRLAALRDPNRAIILIEHVPELIARLCDRLVVLEAGRVIADGATAAVMDDPRVRAAWLGTRYDPAR